MQAINYIVEIVSDSIRKAIEHLRKQYYVFDLTDLLRCKRLFYFENLARQGKTTGDVGEEKRINLQKLFGTLIHEFINMPGCVKEPKLEFCQFDVCIRFKPDFWCPSEKEVIEIKTVSRLANIPRLNHIAQLKAYMIMLGAEKGSLVYISRTTGEVKVFEFKPHSNPSRALNVLFGRALEFKDIVAGNGRVVPEPEPGIWCRNCPYRNRCNTKVDEANLGEHKLIELLKIVADKA